MRGNDPIFDADKRSVYERRRKGLMRAYAKELGGEDNITSVQAAQLRVAATLHMELIRMETGFSSATEVPAQTHEQYRRTVDRLDSTLRALGLTKDLKLPTRSSIARKGAPLRPPGRPPDIHPAPLSEYMEEARKRVASRYNDD